MRVVTRMSLTQAVDLTRTGDVWLFRGHSGADRAIQTLTNAPVNHVGMAVVLEDLPPLMWHAELGRSLPDVWAGEHRRGAPCTTCTMRSRSGRPSTASGPGSGSSSPR